MPTQRKDKKNRWLARVIVDGEQRASRYFPPGKKYGPEWRAAKEWEETTKQAILKGIAIVRHQEAQADKTATDLERLLAWAEGYLEHAERTMRQTTLSEKEGVMQEFFGFCMDQGLHSLKSLSRGKVYEFLAHVADKKGLSRANTCRKNLLAAWAWGVTFIEGFPQGESPLAKIPPFAVEEGERYVPPEEDVIKVLRLARGQDLVMLLTYYFTGGRKSELFRLSWAKDVRLDEAKLRLVDYKGKGGKKRTRWYDMHPELVKAYRWWWAARPCKVDNVFMQTHCDSAMGQPFKQRRHLMPRLCERAGVKTFGFHGLRHKAAAITFRDGGISNAQVLMGHEHATTTNRYVRSAGLYTDQAEIIDALAKNGIGQEGLRLLKQEMPLEGESQEAFCNPENVTNILQ